MSKLLKEFNKIVKSYQPFRICICEFLMVNGKMRVTATPVIKILKISTSFCAKISSESQNFVVH